VADGALDEVVDMLQRINELSVKAYNGTNTEEDRKYIQSEVTQLIKEIERIADTTTFNEIPVFKGNPTESVQITEDTLIPVDYNETVSCELPEWFKNGIDDKLELHSYTGLKQDTSGIMYKTETDQATGDVTYKYYGPYAGDVLYDKYEYGGEWTETLDNNATAKISFEGLTTCDDALKLYSNVQQLIGGAVGVPCGTCSRKYYGIGFSGDEGITATPQYFINEEGTKIQVGANLDLSEWKGFTSNTGEKVNCFDKIKELITAQSVDKTLTEDEKKAQTLALADEIAQKLCQATYDKLVTVTENKDHFDKALTDGKYDIIVYDYRDEEQLASIDAADANVNTAAIGKMKVTHEVLEPGTKVEEQHPMWIVCSAQFGDVIPLELPLINVDTLGITGYDVSRYTEQETVSYSDSYLADLEAWENDYHLETRRIPEKTYQITVPQKPSLISETPIYNENGEFMGMKQEWQANPPITQTITEAAHDEAVKVYNREKPVPKEGDINVTRTVTYDPDSNRTIKDALEYVMNCRTLLGAQQNRLEHAYNNNQNKHENLSASESRIRDTDIAKEMVDYSNNNILEQAGVSVLSQANQSTQLILQLLQ
jgi:flagellin-like hook-associated protein FlgL